jgi:hypothetical protein
MPKLAKKSLVRDVMEEHLTSPCFGYQIPATESKKKVNRVIHESPENEFIMAAIMPDMDVENEIFGALQKLNENLMEDYQHAMSRFTKLATEATQCRSFQDVIAWQMRAMQSMVDECMNGHEKAHKRLSTSGMMLPWARGSYAGSPICAALGA